VPIIFLILFKKKTKINPSGGQKLYATNTCKIPHPNTKLSPSKQANADVKKIT